MKNRSSATTRILPHFHSDGRRTTDDDTKCPASAKYELVATIGNLG